MYIRLLDRLLRAARVSMPVARSECSLDGVGRFDFVSPAKLRPEGWRSVEDSLAVFVGVTEGLWRGGEGIEETQRRAWDDRRQQGEENRQWRVRMSW